VEGTGNYYGVYGLVPSSSKSTFRAGVLGETDVTAGNNPNYAVYGYSADGDGIGVGATASTGYGMYASSDSGYGIYAYSNSNYAVYAMTYTGRSAIYAEASGSSLAAIEAESSSGIYAILAESTANYGDGVDGRSVNGRGINGYDSGYGAGVYGSSAKGWAGEFDGNVEVTGQLTVGSTVYTSDRNLKSDIQPIDGEDVLARLGQLPISSWHYTNAPEKRHVGPMAQDFHAAFGLNGDDETHISEVDIAGVSLAAIKALNSELKVEKAAQAAQIAELRATVATQARTVAEMKQQFAELSAALEKLQADRVAVNR